jgi:hypothetical protein
MATVWVADYSRILTEINIWISRIASIIRGTFAKVIVEYTKVTYPSGLDNSPAPPTTSLHIAPIDTIHHWFIRNLLSSLLSFIILTVSGWVLP